MWVYDDETGSPVELGLGRAPSLVLSIHRVLSTVGDDEHYRRTL